MVNLSFTSLKYTDPTSIQKIKDFVANNGTQEVMKKLFIQHLKESLSSDQYSIPMVKLQPKFSEKITTYYELKSRVIDQFLLITNFEYLPNAIIDEFSSLKFLPLQLIYQSLELKFFQTFLPSDSKTESKIPLMAKVTGMNPKLTLYEISNIITTYPWDKNLEKLIFSRPQPLILTKKYFSSFPIKKPGMLVIKSSEQMRQLSEDEIKKSYNFSILNLKIKKRLRNFDQQNLQYWMVAIFCYDSVHSVDEVFRVCARMAMSESVNVKETKLFYHFIINHPEDFDQCDLMRNHISAGWLMPLTLYAIYKNRGFLNLPPFIPLHICLYNEHEYKFSSDLYHLYTSLIANSFKKSRLDFITTGKYSPIVISVVMNIFLHDKCLSGHAISTYLIPCPQKEGVQWYNWWVDPSRTIKDKGEYGQLYDQLQSYIYGGWSTYHHHMSEYFTSPETLTVVDCAKNFQGPYLTCQLWTSSWIVNILYNFRLYKTSFCDPHAVEKFCETFSRVISLPEQREKNIAHIHKSYYLLNKFVYLMAIKKIINEISSKHIIFTEETINKILDHCQLPSSWADVVVVEQAIQNLDNDPSLASSPASEIPENLIEVKSDLDSDIDIDTDTDTDTDTKVDFDKKFNEALNFSHEKINRDKITAYQTFNQLKEQLESYNIFKGMKLENKDNLDTIHSKPEDFNLLHYATQEAGNTSIIVNYSPQPPLPRMSINL